MQTWTEVAPEDTRKTNVYLTMFCETVSCDVAFVDRRSQRYDIISLGRNVWINPNTYLFRNLSQSDPTLQSLTCGFNCGESE